MNYYEILKIDQNASLDEINQAFRNLAKKYHPDYNNEDNAKEIFMNIYLAYSVLKDAKTKKEYDNTLNNRRQKAETNAREQPGQPGQPKPEEDFIGNTPGNLNNGGYAAAKDGWIYFDDKGLCKSRFDGTGKQKLTEDNGEFYFHRYEYINVINDWIYFVNAADKKSIYRIRTDGTGKQKICNDNCWRVHAAGSWIYYSNMNDNNKLYRINTDGTGRQKLNDDESRHVNLATDWIFYENVKDGYSLYRIRTDGTDRQKFNSDECWGGVCLDGEWIYYIDNNLNKFGMIGDTGIYINKDSGCGLFKIRTDGTDKQLVDCKNKYNDINISDGWIYYVNDLRNGQVCKVRTDGTGRQKLCNDGECSGIIVAGGWVFYESRGNGYKIHKMRTDGTEKKVVS